MSGDQRTVTQDAPIGAQGETTGRFRLRVVEGPGAGQIVHAARCAIGSHPLNDLVIDDPTVSRFHCEVRIDDSAVRIGDLRSKNGTIVDGVRIVDAFLGESNVLQLGRVVIQFENRPDRDPVAVSANQRFGSLVGASPAIRRTFALLERAAASDATVLLEGETGTGKGKAAEALHAESVRGGKPFIVVDCGAIPAALLESELFGHEKGAFTGATTTRIGAFEEASGGTIFLDEIGELPAELQPKLLRVLENKEIRRVGANRHLPIDIRLVAATNRDLRAEINDGRFRADLYYRLAVVTIRMPPLRGRREDLPFLVEEVLDSLHAPAGVRVQLLASIQALGDAPWPGNVRELRNYVERALVMPEIEAEGSDPIRVAGGLRPFPEARRNAQAAFERGYLETLFRDGTKVAEAAQVAGVDRVYLYRLLRRHGLKPPA